MPLTSDVRTATPLVSVVVPVLNEAKNVEPLYRAVGAVMSQLEGYTWEFVFVDDGSSDDSLLVLSRLAERDPSVKVLALSRNFGKEIALTAGVTYAIGDAVVTLDADLQHPPELLPKLLAKWRAGAEVVVATRGATARKTMIRRASSRVFATFARTLIDNELVEDGSTDYRLIDANVRAAFLLVRERRRAYRQIVDWLGFVRETVEFDAAERHRGQSTYSLSKLWDLAIDMVVSRSSMPLRFLLYLGFVISVVSSLVLAWTVVTSQYGNRDWTNTPLAQATAINALLAGIVVTAIGVLGLYVARIHDEVMGRPLFVVRATRNLHLQPALEPASGRISATSSTSS